ncbi:MAG: hypothetical protein MUF31_09515 [Akkermansiaceae bacterium]|nr:hypothetical protein [Akkermansiaceae bacterium]
MKTLILPLLLTAAVHAAGTLTVSTPGYPANRSAEYSISHVYIDEVAGTNAPITFRFVPGVANVIDVELWTNINRRDLANIDKNNDGYPDGVVPPDGSLVTDSAADTDPVTGHYFAPLNLTNVGAGAWEITVPVSKTGAYRATARFRTSDNPGTWQWYGLRDHAVVAAPVIARDIRLYEINVFNIEATSADFAGRSTIEDLHNAPGAPHNANNRWDLDYLGALGCNWLWFQPIHPNGIAGRENNPATGNPYDPGSPYAVKNFFEVNELMTVNYNGSNTLAQNRAAAMTAWKNFVTAADDKEVGIMLDAPFNHTAFDVELDEIGVQLFQRDGEPAWSPYDEIRNRDARFFSRNGNYAQRAFDANSIAAGPDRFDFGKWNDVKDVFFGRYDALVEFDSEPERSSYLNEGDWFDYSQFEWSNGDFVQGGQSRNVTRRVWEYFARYATHWLEQTRPAGQNRNSQPGDGDLAARYAWDAAGIDGLRCDFGQGLPPQAWEYIINTARSKKWSFVMMTESLDGGSVTYRSARHFEVLNENIVFPLKSVSNKFDVRNIYESRRSSYGQALVLSNTTSHDEETLADPWGSVVRFLASSTLDGAPMIFPGQELGISTTFGYDFYETNFGKQIPHFKRWNTMQPIWNNTDFGNDQLFPVIAGANLARAASPALRSSNRWFLDGDGNNAQIHAVAKYETANASPAVSDVVLAFSNLDRNNNQADNFKIPATLAGLLGLQDGRTYNARNIAAYENPTIGMTNRRSQWLWGAGLTGSQLKSTGFLVSLNDVPTTSGEWSSAPYEAQYLKVSDITAPTATPAAPEIANLHPFVIGTQVVFDWDDLPADAGGVVPAYQVTVWINGGAPVLTTVVTASTYTVSAAEGDEVQIAVRAVNPDFPANAAPGSSSSGNIALLSSGGDEDGDGMSNADELAASTNALDAGSVFRATGISRNGTDVVVSFSSVSGVRYRLESSTTLNADWTPVGAELTASGASSQITHAGAAGERRFYRVRVVP